MATATTQLVEAPVITMVEQFTINLDRDEAQVLHDILSRIGGDQLESRRRFSDSIYEALDSVGTFVEDTEVYKDVSFDDSIYFCTVK
jgi:hypothetical protein